MSGGNYTVTVLIEYMGVYDVKAKDSQGAMQQALDMVYEKHGLKGDDDENKDEYPSRNPTRWLIEWRCTCKTCIRMINACELCDELLNNPNGYFKKTVMYGCVTKGDIPN